jgi:hypothetical protein
VKRRTTEFNPTTRQLIVRGLQGDAPTGLLSQLQRAGVLASHSSERPSCRQNRRFEQAAEGEGLLPTTNVTVTLAEHQGLPANNLLERLARELARIPKHHAVHDPWEIGDRPVDIDLAVELIGDVLRANAEHPRISAA